MNHLPIAVHRPWTPEDEALLVEHRLAEVPYATTAAALGRSENALRQRWSVLRHTLDAPPADEIPGRPRDREGPATRPYVLQADGPERYDAPMTKRCRSCRGLFRTEMVDQVTCTPCGAVMEPAEASGRSVISCTLAGAL